LAGPEEKPITYLILLQSDNPDHHPAIWLTQATDLSMLINKCGSKFNTVNIFELTAQESYIAPEHVAWGGIKLKHITTVEPNHQFARALVLLGNSLWEMSHEQIQERTQHAIERVVEMCKRRLSQPNVPELALDEELIDLTLK
jgi:hypothetical protein